MTSTASRPQWQLHDSAPDLYFSSLTHMGLIKIDGEQSASFMHGQVTTDITGLAPEQWRWGAHCDPKGKMLASFRIYTLADELFALMPHTAIATDLPQLQKYAVFSKAELTNVSDEYQLIGVAGERASSWVKQQFGDITNEVTPIEGGVILKDGAETPRFIMVLTKAIAKQLIDQASMELVDATAWQALEIAAGYPNLDAEHTSQFVPQMCNLQAIDGISFNKGCYMGQETVARMKYRGGNKRALYILTGTTQSEVTLASKLEIELDDGFRRAGSIIEFVQRGEQVLLTAVLANDTPDDAKLRFAVDEASSLAVQALPYSLEEAE